jgi:Xaa-Pro aminopeptidase
MGGGGRSATAPLSSATPMTHADPEWNREGFEPRLLLEARARSWELLDEAFALVTPGMRSDEARARVDAMLVARTGARPWHPTQLRVDAETVLPFGAKPAELAVVREGSLVFVDMGPTIDGYEGDVAATRRVGGAADPLTTAAEELHAAVAARWRHHRATGRELYAYAAAAAGELGYALALAGASGHRLADHPHEVRTKLRALDRCPRACAWVLEIHLLDEARGVGAFYEDLLY